MDHTQKIKELKSQIENERQLGNTEYVRDLENILDTYRDLDSYDPYI